MSTYVLIHGSWHGAWCWEKVVALLEERRHRVVAPDLPGHGQDETPPSEVTLRRCADSVCACSTRWKSQPSWSVTAPGAT